jgi:hypothetical protein
MDWTALITAVLPYLAGPAALGVGMFLFVGLISIGGYYIVTKYVWPSVEARFTTAQTNTQTLMTAQSDNIKTLIEDHRNERASYREETKALRDEHRQDRDVFKEAISTLTMGQTAIQSKMDDLVDEVKDLAHTVDDVGDKLKELDEDVGDLKMVKRSSKTV